MISFFSKYDFQRIICIPNQRCAMLDLNTDIVIP